MSRRHDRQSPAKASPLQVLLISEHARSARLIEEGLQGTGCILETHLEQIQDLERLVNDARPDVVLIMLDHPEQSLLDGIRRINHDHPVPVLLFAADRDTDTINRAIKSGVSAYVVDDFRADRLRTIIDIAIARFREQKALRDELERTKTKLEERKVIERAKGILIKTRGFTEDEAYHTLRKLAMDRNVSVADMARNVIAMAEILG